MRSANASATSRAGVRMRRSTRDRAGIRAPAWGRAPAMIASSARRCDLTGESCRGVADARSKLEHTHMRPYGASTHLGRTRESVRVAEHPRTRPTRRAGAPSARAAQVSPASCPAPSGAKVWLRVKVSGQWSPPAECGTVSTRSGGASPLGANGISYGDASESAALGASGGRLWAALSDCL